jgi:hypothetical protein
MPEERNNKHFMIYYKSGTGTFVVTEPRPWARENQRYFPDHDFSSGAPRTKEVNQVLIERFNFVRQDYDGQNITVLFNLNPNLDI